MYHQAQARDDLELQRFKPTLVLNADYRPLSYYPLSIWTWQEAARAVVMDRVNVVSTYDQRISSPSISFALPSVVSLKRYVRQSRKPTFTRFNVFLRDHFQCQYCGSPDDLTFDHLIPRCKGGRTTWENVLTACSSCNLEKGGKLWQHTKLRPRTLPSEPSMQALQKAGRKISISNYHESWLDYLYWDSELDA